MNADFNITCAICSDLHCHALGTDTSQESFLTANAPRKPVGKHPVQSLLKVFEENSITADVVLCPGDLSNRVCSAGMSHAFDCLGEIKRTLKAELLLTTLGNHDVDSRGPNSGDQFNVARNLHPEFPTDNIADADSFWARGFYFKTFPKGGTDFLILNTVIDHTNKETAQRGTFSYSRIDVLREALEKRSQDLYESSRFSNRVAVMHHHPLVHSTIDYGSRDVLEFGDLLLNLLGQFGFKIVIHGHRHDPRVTHASAGGMEQLIVASGSFSAFLGQTASITRNLFHILTLKGDEHNLAGCIKSWEYNFGLGWTPSTKQSAALPHYVGFTIPQRNLEVSSIRALCDSAPGQQIRGADIANKCPDLLLQLPGRLSDLQKDLSASGYKLIINEHGEVEACGRLPISEI